MSSAASDVYKRQAKVPANDPKISLPTELEAGYFFIKGSTLEFLLSGGYLFWVPGAPPGFSLIVSQTYKIGRTA